MHAVQYSQQIHASLVLHLLIADYAFVDCTVFTCLEAVAKSARLHKIACSVARIVYIAHQQHADLGRSRLKSKSCIR